jgi:hypothetical protein
VVTCAEYQLADVTKKEKYNAYINLIEMCYA